MTRSLTDYADDVWNGAADDNIAQSGSGWSGVLAVADGVGFHASPQAGPSARLLAPKQD